MDYLFAPEEYRTDRFVLQSFMPGDGALFADARNTSFDHPFHQQFMRWEEPELTEDVCEKMVRIRRAKYLMAEDFSIGIFSPDEDMLLGETGFHMRMGHGLLPNAAHMNMWIRASHVGQGLGFEVLKAMLAWGFSEWPWDRLSWFCDARNDISQYIAQKAGMQEEGVLRSLLWYPHEPNQDLVCLSILREDVVAV